MSGSVEDIASNRKLACGTLDSLARVHFPCIPLLLMLYSQKDVRVFFFASSDKCLSLRDRRYLGLRVASMFLFMFPDSTERLPTVGRFYIYFGIKKNIWSGFRSLAHVASSQDVDDA